jgi:catalase
MAIRGHCPFNECSFAWATFNARKACHSQNSKERNHMSDNGQQNNGQEHEGKQPHLTTRQGHPVSNNQDSRTVGDRGPTTLENYQFLEKISHFDRERIPERVVHARGAGAHGFFEALWNRRR